MAQNGLFLLSGDDQGWIIQWFLLTRRPVAVWRAHKDIILGICYLYSELENDDLCLTQGRDNKLKIWRFVPNEFNCKPPVTNEQYPSPLLVHMQDINALNFCAVAVRPRKQQPGLEDLILAVPSTTSSSHVDVYRISPFERLAKAIGPSTSHGIVMSLAFSNDHLFAGFDSGNVVGFSMPSFEQVFDVKISSQPVLSLSASSETLLIGSAGREMASLHYRDYILPLKMSVKSPSKGLASIGCTDSFVACVYWDGKLRIREPDTLTEIDCIDGPGANCLALAAVSKVPTLRPLPAFWIAVGCKNGRIYLHGFELALTRSKDA